MDNKKMVLAYGLTAQEIAELKNAQMPVKEITAVMASMKIGQIIEGLKFEIYNKEMPKEKVILFNNFSDEELDFSVKLARVVAGRECILAVVTPTSIDWTFEYLLEHLVEEREWFKNRAQENNKQ